jgi:pyruvate,water dikinase
VVDGHPVVDLDLLGVLPPKRTFVTRFDPRPPYRRLRMAWRVGRLKLAEPEIAAGVVRHLDVLLDEVPPVAHLDTAQLLGVWARGGEALRCAHAHEVLCGLLLDDDGKHQATGAGVALRMLADGRRLGLDDQAIVARYPEVLALTAPRIGTPNPLPALSGLDVGWRGGHDGLSPREQLRLRVRWLHELTALVAMEIGHRLVDRGVLDDALEIRWFGLVQLDRLSAAGGRRPDPVVPRDRRSLPAAFRLAGDGRPVAVAQAGAGSGVGAAGGTFTGIVTHEATEAVGRVLVVRWLDPGLAAVLSGLGAIVAETGSPLSHLAILAREQGVPCVVGSSEAMERFLPGQTVTVDGSTGDVTIAEPEGPNEVATDLVEPVAPAEREMAVA